MYNFDSKDTIIACSTGLTSNTAIGVLRISGNNFLNQLFKVIDLNVSKLKKRHAHFCKIIYEEVLYDEVVLTYFAGPNSYNGEDIVEISVHGNQLNIQRIIDLICNVCGFRKAQPGEFTQRALRNKKLNFSQVEGLDLLLNANSIFSLEQGFSLLSGSMKKDFQDLYNLFLKHKTTLEMGFDFLDDVGEEQFNQHFTTSLNELRIHIEKLHKRCLNVSGSLIQPDIALFGKPNAGKSSFFNIILNDERAIVSNVAGTTRDFISEKINIEGHTFNIFDTAGIRESSDYIESVGIEKAKEKIENAFYKILLVNVEEIGVNEFDLSYLKDIDLVLFTHIDKTRGESSKIISEFNFLSKLQLFEIKNDTGPIEPKNVGPIEPKKAGPIEPKSAGPIEPKSAGPIEPKKTPCIFTNLLSKNSNLDSVISSLIHQKFEKFMDFDPILIERHKDSVNKVYLSFRNYSDIASDIDDMAIISSELNIVGHCISELIGIISPDDVLNNLFSNFCIGK